MKRERKLTPVITAHLYKVSKRKKHKICTHIFMVLEGGKKLIFPSSYTLLHVTASQQGCKFVPSFLPASVRTDHILLSWFSI